MLELYNVAPSAPALGIPPSYVLDALQVNALVELNLKYRSQILNLHSNGNESGFPFRAVRPLSVKRGKPNEWEISKSVLLVNSALVLRTRSLPT
jgi:hypothetical protein